MYSSDADDMVAVERYQSQGLSMAQAIAQVAQDKYPDEYHRTLKTATQVTGEYQ